MVILPKAIYKFWCNSYQITYDIFNRSGTHTPKTYVEPEKTQNCQGNPEEKNKAGGISLLDFQQYYKTIAIKNSVVWEISWQSSG